MARFGTTWYKLPLKGQTANSCNTTKIGRYARRSTDRYFNQLEKGARISMRKFSENKFTFNAILLLFALAMTCNASTGVLQSNANSHTLTAATQGKVAVQK